MITALLFTIAVESAVVLGYSLWRRKPLISILITSLLGNLVTQTLLWMVLRWGFQDYLLVLGIAEILIWLLESIFLASVPANQLSWREAARLSLGMNFMSLALGWFLPV